MSWCHEARYKLYRPLFMKGEKMSQFTKYGFPEFIMNALEKMNFKTPTEIQEQIIPLVLKGESVIGQSQTGSGKSHSFLLPLIATIDPNDKKVQVVITSPSRELAEQLYRATQLLIESTSITVSKFIGGTDKQRQIAKLSGGQPQIVIGTPGRILDLMQSNDLLAHTATKMVIDEADMTLDLGFLDDVDNIASQFGKSLQMLVFSATIPQKLKPFLKKYMDNPKEVVITPKTVIANTVTNKLLATKGQNTNALLFELLTMGNPYLAMVFANTKQKVEEMTHYLREKGLKVAMIHGDVQARERKRLMKMIQNLEYQYVVATGLVARGIDIEGVSLVINAEVPKDLDFFIHRVGRTGRNGLNGEAITFYAPGDDELIVQLEKRGVVFEPVTLKHGELINSHDRNRREKREKSPVQEDSIIKGMVKKAKKSVKPGYKRKLKEQIQQRERQKKRQEKRKK